jgi:uncharacterized membrane protein
MDFLKKHKFWVVLCSAFVVLLSAALCFVGFDAKTALATCLLFLPLALMATAIFN